MKIRKLVRYVLSLPNSIFFNFYYFGLRGLIKLPIIISYRAKICSMGSRKSVRIDNDLKFGIIRIGLDDGSFFQERSPAAFWNVESDATVIFKGVCRISKGGLINVSNKGKLVFGDFFISNANMTVSCSEYIELGDNVLCGWNCTLIDWDGHGIYLKEDIYKRNMINEPKKINIGKHCWLASNVTILKGTCLPNETIIACNSCISKSFDEENTIIAGNPGKVIKTGVAW